MKEFARAFMEAKKAGASKIVIKMKGDDNEMRRLSMKKIKNVKKVKSSDKSEKKTGTQKVKIGNPTPRSKFLTFFRSK